LGLVWKDLDLKFKAYEFWKLEMFAGNWKRAFQTMGRLLALTGLATWVEGTCAWSEWALAQGLMARPVGERASACDEVTRARTALLVLDEEK
jgi:hypothetical protein